jgi:hypothetical protein
MRIEFISGRQKCGVDFDDDAFARARLLGELAEAPERDAVPVDASAPRALSDDRFGALLSREALPPGLRVPAGD